jgi:hypothetical protein
MSAIMLRGFAQKILWERSPTAIWANDTQLVVWVSDLGVGDASHN